MSRHPTQSRGDAEKPLAGRVAVVAGATRGAGRGIARALGEAGATVYCTGRSVCGSPSPYARPETIEETAEMITAAGGTAVAVRVDHTDESQVEALFARASPRRCARTALPRSPFAGVFTIVRRVKRYLEDADANAGRHSIDARPTAAVT